MQLLDVTTAEWSADLCTLAGMEPRQLSPILPAGAAVGLITPEVSRLISPPAKTVVVNGGHDLGCTALGLGVTSPGKILLGCGTAWVVMAVTDAPDVAAPPQARDLNGDLHPAVVGPHSPHDPKGIRLGGHHLEPFNPARGDVERERSYLWNLGIDLERGDRNWA